MKDEMTDEQLIREAVAGNGHAFSQLVDRHYVTVYKMAYKYVGVREDAEDIAQNASIKLGRSLGGFRFDSAFTTWLYRMVINTAKDYLKKKGRTQMREVDLYEDAIGIAGKDNPESQAQQREALQMISKLPEKLRDAVILVHWQGLTHKEAAEVLDISENTVSWRLHEVRKYFNDTGKEAHHG
tara:strand:+ start:657 stop:1205 length:549 start_codon:yes stop_codon:yes gene_type:complete